MKNTGANMTENMSQAGSGSPVMEGQSQPKPHKGDRYRCKECGMEVQVTSDCQCKDDHAHFHCCGQEMQKV